MNISSNKIYNLKTIISKNDYTQKFEEASKSMELLSSHQSWFSGKIGLSLSYSLKNLVIHLVKAKQEELTEYNCAKMLKSLCDAYNKIGNNKNVNNALKIANLLLEYHSNKGNATTSHFSDEIAKFEKTNLFTNSRYTEYSNIKDNNVPAINITGKNDNNYSSITINNSLENAEAVSPILAPKTWMSETPTTNSFGKKYNNQSIVITENPQIIPKDVSQTFTNSIKVTPKNKINEDLEELEKKYIRLDHVIFELNMEAFKEKEKIFDKANIDQIITLADNYKKLDKKGKYFLLHNFISKQSRKFSKDKTSSINSDNESKKIVEKLIDNLKKTNYLSTNLFFMENLYQAHALEKEARYQFLKTLL